MTTTSPHSSCLRLNSIIQAAPIGPMEAREAHRKRSPPEWLKRWRRLGQWAIRILSHCQLLRACLAVLRLAPTLTHNALHPSTTGAMVEDFATGDEGRAQKEAPAAKQRKKTRHRRKAKFPS